MEAKGRKLINWGAIFEYKAKGNSSCNNISFNYAIFFSRCYYLEKVLSLSP